MKIKLTVVLISITIFIFSFIPAFLITFSPRYYFGNRDFNIDQYIEQGIRQKREMGYTNYHGDDIVFPPKVLSSETIITICLLTLITFLWGLYWSYLVFVKRPKVVYRYIVWLTFSIYLLTQGFLAFVLISGAVGKD